MKILFLDQSGKPGGAELFLLDIAKAYRDRCLVGLFTDGLFRLLLQEQQIPVRVLSSQALQVRKQSGWIDGLKSIKQLLPLVRKVVWLSRDYDLIYANTQKALVVGALASVWSRRPLVYHLHDLLTPEHFSAANRRLAILLANRFARRVIATSDAVCTAFIEAGGDPDRAIVVYNGFEVEKYQIPATEVHPIRQTLELEGRFVVGHFSRLSPWKGQHVLIEALQHCPEDTVALFVGDALYGEEAYKQELEKQVVDRGLQDRVRFLGFRSDIVPLMHACDVIVHTSTAPEPFGRVIVEGMLCGRPVIATNAGGAVELLESGETGWLVPPDSPGLLATAIADCRTHPEQAATLAKQAQFQASQRFNLNAIQQQITYHLNQLEIKSSSVQHCKSISVPISNHNP